MKSRKSPILADKEHCTGCMSCVDSCPVGAITDVLNDEHHLTYRVNNDICISCGKCEKACPVVSNLYYGVNELKLSKIYAGWCTDKDLRKESSSGGVGAALAKHVIQDGGVAVGASLEGFTVHHKAIYHLDEIRMLQGSKYIQSNTTGIYKAVREILKDGRKVVFSGLACQVAGLLSFLGEKFDKKNLLTVDIICGGVPSNFLIEKFAEENKDRFAAINGFREKQRYQFSVLNKYHQVEVIPLSAKPLPLCGFYTELTNRMCCYDCMFAYAHRISDITIGDFWGEDRFREQHKDGISAIVVHTGKGLESLRKSELEIYDASWHTFLLNNHRMIDGRNSLGKSKTRKNLARAINKYSKQDFLCKYANYATIKRPWTWVFKLWRFAERKVFSTYDKRKIIKILEQL